ncbi:MAG: hypothetical protein JNG85_08405 [Spirochaetaceae bacterium]|nr:hypothetical protein [Spirochaetaceae bacterium]
MTILYRISKSPDPLELEVKSFADFEAFILELGAGPSRESAREQTRAWWAELYREMQEPDFRPRIIALGRLPELGRTVTILGAKECQ